MMLAISEAELLDVWERCAGESPARSSMALLLATTPGTTVAALRSMTLGERDRRLLALRAELFGAEAECWARCDQCAEQVEFTLDVSALVALPTDTSRPVDPLVIDGLRISCRLPTSGDLLGAIALAPDAREDALVAACVVEVADGDQPVDVHTLAGATREAIAAHLSDVDDRPLTEITFGCPSCGATTTAPFDVTSHLFTELDDWARAVLADIHDMAWAYGWTEPEILALSGWRRRHYLEQIRR